MSKFNPVPLCPACARGYGKEHWCETPDFCPCDQRSMHMNGKPPSPVQQTFNLYCPRCGAGFVVLPQPEQVDPLKGWIDVKFKEMRVTHRCPRDQ